MGSRKRENADLNPIPSTEASLRGDQIAVYHPDLSTIQDPAASHGLRIAFNYIDQLRGQLAPIEMIPTIPELTMPMPNPFIAPPPPPPPPTTCTPPTLIAAPTPTIMDFLFAGENAFAPGDGFLYTGNVTQARIEIIEYFGLPTTTPTEIGMFDFPGGFQSMKVGVWGDTMYVTDGFSIQILDVTDRTNPILLAPLVTADQPDYLLCFNQSVNPCICKPILATTSGSSGLVSLYDLSVNPLAPTLLDTIALGGLGNTNGLNSSRRGVLFVASADVNTTWALNISNPTNIQLFSSFNAIGPHFRSFYQSWGNGYLYTCDTTNKLIHIINVKDPNNMFLEGTPVAADWPDSCCVDGSFLFSVANIGGAGIGPAVLNVFDIQDPITPILALTVPLPSVSLYSYGLLTRDGAFVAHAPTTGLPLMSWFSIEFPNCCNCNPALFTPAGF